MAVRRVAMMEYPAGRKAAGGVRVETELAKGETYELAGGWGTLESREAGDELCQAREGVGGWRWHRFGAPPPGRWWDRPSLGMGESKHESAHEAIAACRRERA